MWASSSIRAHLLFLLDPANQSMESQILFQSELPPATFICIWNPRYILLNTREPSIIPSLFQSYLHVRANLSLACPIRLNQANASNKSSDLQHEHHIPRVLMHASSRWSPYFKLHRIYQNLVSTVFNTQPRRIIFKAWKVWQNLVVGCELGNRSPIFMEETIEFHNTKLGCPRILKLYQDIPKVLVDNFGSQHMV